LSAQPGFPFLKNIGFMLTYKCTMSCPHCIVEAGPKRRKEMGLEESLDWIRQVSFYRNKHILTLGLTGGEPFYDLDRLEVISTHAREHGLFVTTVTNAFWATTKDQALKILQRMKGIQLISLSTDAHHQKLIPIENIKNAAWAARETGHLYDIAICTDSKTDPSLLLLEEDLRASGEGEHMKVTVTAPVGRAQKLMGHNNFKMESVPAGGGCVLANSPLVFPNGKVIGCTGAFVALPPTHPMLLGDLRQDSLETILDRSESNPYLHAMRLWGPYGFSVILMEHGFGHLLPKEYIKDCPCDACFKLFTDRRLVKALDAIMLDDEMLKLVAIGRAAYLDEPALAQSLGLPMEELKRSSKMEEPTESGNNLPPDSE
jgi:organic radical activating enzyme